MTPQVSWADLSIQQSDDELGLDRLSLASHLLGATGWIDSLARLIAIDTSVEPGRYTDALAAALQDMFVPLGFGFRRLSVPAPLTGRPEAPARINMLAARRTGRRVCTIYFHVDTMPAGPGWSRPPFALSRQGSRLYGRGVADMKGAIAAVWSALRAADAVGLGLRFDPVLVFCTDEDGGLYPGLQHLAEGGMIEGHVMCLNGAAAPRIWAGSPGQVTLKVRISAAPESGALNAIEAGEALIHRFNDVKPMIEARHSDALALTAQGKPVRAALSVSSLQGADLPVPAPESCELTVTRDYIPEERLEDVEGQLFDVVSDLGRALPGIDVRASLQGHYAPVISPDQGPNGPRWQQALGWGFGFAGSQFRRSACGTPSAMGFVQQAGVQEILLSGLGRSHHQKGEPNEFTTIEDVDALARTVLAYLADIPEIPRY